MWLSQRRQTELEETTAELGQVTVPGAPAGVALAGERRAHAIGTARAIEMGPVEGAMSSLAVAVAGLLTVVFVSGFAQLI